jgi:hypothetical protein
MKIKYINLIKIFQVEFKNAEKIIFRIIEYK